MKKKNRILIYTFSIMVVLIMFTASCSKDNNTTGQVPVLSTLAVSNISQTSANCGGNITSDGGSTVTARGVCWGIGMTPTITNSKSSDGLGAGNFTSAITNLSPNTMYFVRAYATNAAGTGYGSAMSFTTLQALTDIDGNVYHTVSIGTQVWMVENLKTSKYRNGDPIPNVTDNAAWINLTTGAYCDYENTASNSSIYGKLYNWYAVNDSRSIAPTGWHIPSDAEWTQLTTYLGGETTAAHELKESGTNHWTSPNDADNTSGFTALPAGYRYSDATFWYIGTNTLWWSSTMKDATTSYTRFIYNTSSLVTKLDRNQKMGFSVRCLKD